MPVELGYFTLPVKNLARAKTFYGALFGWEIEEGGHVANTTFPLGLSPERSGGISERLFPSGRHRRGGRARDATRRAGAARNQYPSGPNAVCADPDGTVFSLWQPAPGYE